MRQTDNGPGAAPPNNPVPELGGVRFGPGLAVALYVLLFLSAALALWDHRSPGVLPVQVQKLAPWSFLLFVVLFAGYRLRLVQVRRYPAGKALVQLGIATAFLMLLMPWAKDRYASPDTESLVSSLADPNPKVRALAAELMGYRSERAMYVRALIEALEDPDAHVRDEAHGALVRIRGKDLGSAEDRTGRKAWRESIQ